MKLGIELDWQRRRFHLPHERLKLVDRLGYDVVFSAESNGSDALTPLAYVLGITERIGVGTRIAQTVGRSPAALAMAFQTLRQLAGPERAIIVGLGNANAHIAEAWHGQPWTKPQARMRDWVAIMRKVFAGGIVEHHGQTISLPYAGPGATGSYAPMTPLLETDPGIPIMCAGGTERMITLAAEIGDGVMPLSYAPGMLGVYRPMIANGFAKRANPPDIETFPIWAAADVIVTDDVKEAMRQFKNYTARYAGGWPKGKVNPFANQLIWRGYGDAQKRIEELYQAGYHDEAADAVPDEMIEEGWLFGPLPRVIARWKSHWINRGVNLIVRTDNWPLARLSGDDVYEPLFRAARG